MVACERVSVCVKIRAYVSVCVDYLMIWALSAFEYLLEKNYDYFCQKLIHVFVVVFFSSFFRFARVVIFMASEW